MSRIDKDNRRILELERELFRRDAKKRLSVFLCYTQPDYKRQWFHEVIADKCQALYDGSLGKDRLMIFVPPQYGKSEIISRKFPAWAFGQNPRLKIIGSSYSGDLAQQFSRSIKRCMSGEEYARLFPDVSLANAPSELLARSDYFDVPGGGFHKSVGVCCSLTGTPADIAIIDDPVKDEMEAYSRTYRDRVWGWYNSVLLTRLHNDSKRILIMTRWHDDDLAGRLLKMEANKWEVVTIPAVCEMNNDGGMSNRKVGEALWPEMHSLESIKEVEQLSPRTYAALYQQRPVVIGGNIIKRDWFAHVSMEEFNRMHHAEPVVFFIDTAYTNNSDNDPTGILATCKIGNELYIIHGEKVLLKFPDLIRFVQRYVAMHGYTSESSIRIEPKANGISVVDQLKEQTGLNVVKTPSPTDDKETRLNAASPSVESGRVVLVDGAWNEPFIDEVCGFPAREHDEYVDILCYAVGYHLTNPYRPIDKDLIASKVY